MTGMITRRRGSQWLVLVAVFLLAGIYQVMAQPAAVVGLTVLTDKDVYYLGDEVEVTIFIRNLSGQMVDVLEPAIDPRSLFIEIIQPNGFRDRMLSVQGLKLDSVRVGTKRRIRFTTKFTPEMLGKFMVSATYFGYQSEAIIALPREIFVVQRKPSP